MKESYFSKALEFENLLIATHECGNGVRWKDSVVGYEANRFKNAIQLRDEVLTNKYKLSKYKEFYIYEPKKRHIKATIMKDRTIQRSLCNAGLYDDIVEHLIIDNPACLKDRGVTFTHDRLKKHLHSYYINHGIDGWVLKCDIHHYFDSISPRVSKGVVDKYISDENARDYLYEIIDSFGYGLGLGSQISQLLALLVLNDLDHFIKEKLHIKYYVRFMDDFLLIHEDKEYLKYCLREIEKRLSSIDLELNSKTSINKLKQGINFMKWRFVLTDSGKVLQLSNAEKIKHIKNKIKKIMYLESRGQLQKGTTRNSFNACLANLGLGNTYKQRQALIRWFAELERTYDYK